MGMCTSYCCAGQPWFITFVTLSLLTHIGEVLVTAYAAYHLYASGLMVWFALATGLLVLPLVACQLLSWQLHTTGSGSDVNAENDVRTGSDVRIGRDVLTGSEVRTGNDVRTGCAEVLVHVLLCAMPWRYLRLAFSGRIAIRQSDIRDMYTVRLVYTFTGTLPALLLHTYVVLHDQAEKDFQLRWQCTAASAMLAVSACWVVATYRKHWDYCCVVGSIYSAAPTMCRLLWRSGELLARVMTLTLFATHHGYWVFLVVGLHLLTMALLSIMEYTLTNHDKSQGRASGIYKMVLECYMHIYCHLHITDRKSKSGFALYHIIVLMESATLLTLWVIYDQHSSIHLPLVLVVSIGYLMGLLGAGMYYSCFYRKRCPGEDPPDNCVCLFQCLACKQSSSGRKNLLFQPASIVYIQDNPNPKFFDMLQTSDSEVTSRVTSSSYGDSDRPFYVKGQRFCGPKNRSFHNCRKDKNQIGQSNNSNMCTAAKGETSSKVQNANESMDLAWDNYDLQATAGPSGANNQIEEASSTPVAAALQDKTRASPRGVLPDQGYHSANSSAKEIAEKNRAELLVHADALLRLPPYITSSATSDENMSTITSISSRLDCRNCGQCGHSMSQDSSSLYSTSTMTSSQYAPPPRAGYPRRPRSHRTHAHGRGVRMGTRAYPGRKKRGSVGWGRRSHVGRDSDTSTSAAYVDTSEA